MHTTAAFLIIWQNLNTSFPTRNQIEITDNTYGFKMSQQRLHIYCIEYLPQIFASAKQTVNYDSDDSVAYGEKFTAITFKT
jgi:hypothetical protein